MQPLPASAEQSQNPGRYLLQLLQKLRLQGQLDPQGHHRAGQGMHSRMYYQHLVSLFKRYWISFYVFELTIQYSQEVCFGGTTDHKQTAQNSQFFWGGGGHGCAIKGGLGFVQNPAYGNPNAPQGAGASVGQQQCCTNAFNLCFYNGDKSSTNFANVVLVAQRSCKSFVGSTNQTAICNFYNQVRNCGNPGMIPLPPT